MKQGRNSMNMLNRLKMTIFTKNPWNSEGFWDIWSFCLPLISYFSLAYHKISTELRAWVSPIRKSPVLIREFGEIASCLNWIKLNTPEFQFSEDDLTHDLHPHSLEFLKLVVMAEAHTRWFFKRNFNSGPEWVKKVLFGSLFWKFSWHICRTILYCDFWSEKREFEIILPDSISVGNPELFRSSGNNTESTRYNSKTVIS